MIWKIALGTFLGVVMSTLALVLATITWIKVMDLMEWARRKKTLRQLRKSMKEGNEIEVGMAPSDSAIREHFDVRIITERR